MGLLGQGPGGVEQEALDHVWVHSAPWAEIAAKDGLRIFERGEGVKLYDVHGGEYLDVISGVWVVNAGHGRAEIADAMAQQARKLARRCYHTLRAMDPDMVYAVPA